MPLAGQGVGGGPSWPWVNALTALAVFLFLGAAIGHVAMGALVINCLYGTRHRGWWVTAIRLADKASIVFGPILFVGFWPEVVLGNEPWAALPWALRAYLWPCWLVGLVILPLVTVGRWLRRVPAPQVAVTRSVVDVAGALGQPPYGQGKRLWLARLPFNEIFQVEFCERTFILPALPRAWDGLSILHLSDLHLCGVPDLAFYEWVMDECMKETPDLLVLTGDVLDSPRHYDWIAPTLGRLRWKVGGYAVLGNHDAQLDAARIAKAIERAGLEMVGGRWTSCTLRGHELVVVGNETPWLGPAPNMDGCPRGDFRLGVVHTPDVLRWAKANKVDLLLAGHNHGGQIVFPLVGPMLVPSWYSRRYDQGLFYEPPTLTYVSRGLGGTYPLRYNCRPEVTWLRLRAGGGIDRPGTADRRNEALQ